MASGLILNATFPLDVLGQTPAGAATTQPTAGQPFNAEQLDALLASIALYPDELLTQVLMASTFPLEVVAAARWVEEPAHRSLSGDALQKALEAEPWDASVKSLVPFPAVLATMNNNLPWLQQLGYAFATQQADVFASVQRLRRRAQANNTLQSSPQQVVSAKQVTTEPPPPAARRQRSRRCSSSSRRNRTRCTCRPIIRRRCAVVTPMSTSIATTTSTQTGSRSTHPVGVRIRPAGAPPTSRVRQADL